MIAFVQDVAADDEVEAPEAGIRRRPLQFPVSHRGQLVQRRVVGEERFGQRMMVGGEHVGTAVLQHEAGQREAATDLEDALAVDRMAAHRFGEHAPGRPHLPEQAPLRRRDADAFGVMVRIGELLQVAERADPIVVVAEAQDHPARGVTVHGAPGCVVPACGKRVAGRERNGRRLGSDESRVAACCGTSYAESVHRAEAHWTSPRGPPTIERISPRRLPIVPRLPAFLAALAVVSAAAAAEAPKFDPQRLSDEVRTLSSDAFEGRGPATPAETRTLAYVIGQMKQAGLQPGGDLAHGRRG